jgi:hypothetical protein
MPLSPAHHLYRRRQIVHKYGDTLLRLALFGVQWGNGAFSIIVLVSGCAALLRNGYLQRRKDKVRNGASRAPALPEAPR